jgi:hypothetical protein
MNGLYYRRFLCKSVAKNLDTYLLINAISEMESLTIIKFSVRWKNNVDQVLMQVIPATWETEIGSSSLAWAKKVNKTPSQPIKLGMVACSCHSSYEGGVNRRIMVQAGPGKNARPY